MNNDRMKVHSRVIISDLIRNIFGKDDGRLISPKVTGKANVFGPIAAKNDFQFISGFISGES